MKEPWKERNNRYEGVATGLSMSTANLIIIAQRKADLIAFLRIFIEKPNEKAISKVALVKR